MGTGQPWYVPFHPRPVPASGLYDPRLSQRDADGVFSSVQDALPALRSLTPNQKVVIPQLKDLHKGFVPIGKNAMRIPQFAPFVSNKQIYTGNFEFVLKHYK